jgi:CheY-like chemotaxis protein
MGSWTVLVVDDQATVRQFVATTLQEQGHHAIQARDAREAIKFASLFSFDLVLTDVVMPGGSGGELVARLKQSGCRASYLYMSSYSPDELPNPKEHVPLLAKPFDPPDLFAAVHQVMGTSLVTATKTATH